MTENKPSLSVCMIVRDEEAALPRCLRSVAAVAREMIVVDTGSTDRTMIIAKEAGARVLPVRWNDDFAQARNVALQAATSDWILSLDADEELDPDSIAALAAALLRPEPAQLVQIHLPFPGAGLEPPRPDQLLPVLRLFRRDPRIRFRGRIHESVVDSVLSLGAAEWPDSGVHLIHHGYLDAGERRRKAGRNLRILRAAHHDEPDNLYVAYKLAQTLPDAEAPRRREVLNQAATQSLRLPAEQLGTYTFLPQLFVRLSLELSRAGELPAAGQICTRAAERLGGSLWFTAGKAWAHAGEHALAESALLRYLEQHGQHGHRGAGHLLMSGDPDASPMRAWHVLGWSALMHGLHVDAKRWLDQALVATPADAARDQHAAIACDRVRIHLRTGHLDTAVPDLSRLATLAQQAGASLARREVLLVSAEVSLLAGDLSGALPLAQAAIERPGTSRDHIDDRGAALAASLLLLHQRRTEAMEMLPLLCGARFDTLAVRLLLEQLSGRHTLPSEVSGATWQMLDELRSHLPGS